MRDRAVQFSEAGIKPDSEQGQQFAQEFWQLIMQFTGGDMGMLPQLMKMGEVNTKNVEWKQKQDIMNAFLSPALEAYFKGKNMDPFEEIK